jgi:putative addiction module killer protein
MYIIKQTDTFSKWLLALKDIKGKVSILRRVDRMKSGNFGDHKAVGDNISELRITTGRGYRVYYTIKNQEVVVLLIAGDKSSQSSDIKKAKKINEELEYE